MTGWSNCQPVGQQWPVHLALAVGVGRGGELGGLRQRQPVPMPVWGCCLPGGWVQGGFRLPVRGGAQSLVSGLGVLGGLVVAT